MPTTKLTHQAIDAGILKAEREGGRSHLGASQIGHDCARALWYQFRWVRRPSFPARVLRLFERGHLEENRFIRWFRNAGISIWEKDPETGRQFRVQACGGHFGGSCDGVGKGFPDLQLTPALVEFKTSNDKYFKQLKKDKVEKVQKKHFVQMQIYMHLMDLPWALYAAINKNDDEIYLEYVRADPEVAKEYLRRADWIIFSEEPPARMSEDRTFYKCKFCDHAGICHGVEMPNKNCRTCCHSTPERSGGWSCARGVEADPRAGCGKWLPIPAIFKGATWEATEEGGGFRLKVFFANGARVNFFS